MKQTFDRKTTGIVKQIDTSKGTLADRILLLSGIKFAQVREDRHDVIDWMPVEKERGIWQVDTTPTLKSP